jgi:hypothetical protein
MQEWSARSAAKSTGRDEMNEQIDTGDYVKHEPSGEHWVVACVDGEYLHWCGWPEGDAKLADCTLLQKATPEQRLKLLKELAEMMNIDCHRKRHALATLEAMAAAPGEQAEKA